MRTAGCHRKPSAHLNTSSFTVAVVDAAYCGYSGITKIDCIQRLVAFASDSGSRVHHIAWRSPLSDHHFESFCHMVGLQAGDLSERRSVGVILQPNTRVCVTRLARSDIQNNTIEYDPPKNAWYFDDPAI